MSAQFGHHRWDLADSLKVDPAMPPGTLRMTSGKSSVTVTGIATALCPDLLRYSQIGAADGPRGRVVRAFFFLMRLWPPAEMRGKR